MTIPNSITMDDLPTLPVGEIAARPGDQLRMEVKVIKARGDAYKFRGETFIDGKLAAEAEFMAMVVKVDQPAAA